LRGVAPRHALRREPARPAALPAQAPRRALRRARPPAAACRAAAPRRARPGRSRPDVPRGRGLARLRPRRRPARMILLLALPLLATARLLPEPGLGLWLRLAAATLVLLLPGALVARALRCAGPAASFAWSTAIVAASLGVTFAFRGSLTLTLVLALAAGA